jgi:hypothetical protein
VSARLPDLDRPAPFGLPLPHPVVAAPAPLNVAAGCLLVAVVRVYGGRIMPMPDPSLADAVVFLHDRGVRLESAPLKWQRRGFAYYAPSVGQMLSVADVIEFASNERDLVGVTAVVYGG